MIDISVANTKGTSYENFLAECPWCGQENIFNRASDLRTFERRPWRRPSAGEDARG